MEQFQHATASQRSNASVSKTSAIQSESLKPLDVRRVQTRVIKFDESQIRTDGMELSRDGMKTSLTSVGQLNPLLLREVENDLVLLEGECRLRAMLELGWELCDAIVICGELKEHEVIERQLIVNCQRNGLRPIDKANAIQRLMSLACCTAGEAATRLGFSEGVVSKSLALLSLPTWIQENIASGAISESAGYELTRVEDPELQKRFAQQMVSKRLTRDMLTKTIKASKASTAKKQNAARRVTAPMGDGRAVTVIGHSLSLDNFITILEELLPQARRFKTTGMELGTFCQMLADKTKQSQPLPGSPL